MSSNEAVAPAERILVVDDLGRNGPMCPLGREDLTQATQGDQAGAQQSTAPSSRIGGY